MPDSDRSFRIGTNGTQVISALCISVGRRCVAPSLSPWKQRAFVFSKECVRMRLFRTERPSRQIIDRVKTRRAAHSEPPDRECIHERNDNYILADSQSVVNLICHPPEDTHVLT